MDAPRVTATTRIAQPTALLRGCLALLIATALFAPGCSRAFYRRQADVEAYALVREKATHPHWRLEDYTIAVDPRSRMYDPHSMDCPPMPPDDPTSHELMHCVDNKRGWPFWHDNGDIGTVQNPAWPEYIEVDERGVIKVSSEDAVRLALLHSPDYQSQLEELYLSALDVSFERFRFDSQFFAGYEVFGTFDGRARSGLARQTGQGGNSSSILEANTRNWSMQKLFPTGAELVVGFANSLVWQFSGPDDYRGTTLIDFALVQPLLRNAGRDRVLERLTVSERALLANVRAMEQYRQAFYVDIITGRNAGGGPQRRGGVFGAGLQGFTGVGGGFGGVGGGGGGGGGGGPAGAGGYMGLLQTQREIINQEDNVRRLRRNVSRLTVLLEEQPSQETGAYLNQGLQVAQARQALLRAESGLVSSRNGYEAQLDTFKADLGLPPQVCLEPVDDMLDQFELIEPEAIRLPEDWETVLNEHTEVRREIPERITTNIEVVEMAGAPPICRLPAYEGIEQDLERLRPALADMQAFVDNIVANHLPAIEQDLERFRAAVPRRKAWIEKLIARIDELSQSPCELLPLGLNPFEAVAGGVDERELLARLDRSLADANSSYEIIGANFRRYAESLASRGQMVEELLANPPLSPEERFDRIVHGVFNPNFVCGKSSVLSIDVLEDVTRDLVELQLIQAVARAEAIELQDIDIKADQALEVARRYRRDWMNNRAALVDSWRLIQFNADQLQSDLNIRFSGDIGNIGDNPFNLNAATGRLRAGVEFDAPLTRLSERNTYRQALLEYQQARRNYYQFEDTVAQQLRGELRTITTNQINFELQRLAVLEAARQVMLNTFIDQEEQRTLTTRVTAARDAVSALADLLDAQNSFMGFWVNYEVLRRGLDLDLGTLQLDSEGLWIDPGRITEEYGKNDPWLWRTGMCLEGEALPEEILPGTEERPAESDDAGAEPADGMAPDADEPPAPQDFERDPVQDLPPPILLPPPAAGSSERPAFPPAEFDLPPLGPREDPGVER
jgi:hypothetical protein